MKIKYELWKGIEGNLTFQAVQMVKLLNYNFPNDYYKKIWEVEADTWEEAMTLYHEYMDWEPYKPMV